MLTSQPSTHHSLLHCISSVAPLHIQLLKCNTQSLYKNTKSVFSKSILDIKHSLSKNFSINRPGKKINFSFKQPATVLTASVR